jgi:hypothetical protein
MGERRWAAAQRVGGPLTVYTVGTWPELYAWIVLDARKRYIEGALPIARTELLAMIEHIRSTIRIPGRSNEDSIFAEYEGLIGRKAIQETRQVAALRGIGGEAMDRMVQQELDRIDRDETKPSSAYDRLQKYLKRSQTPLVSEGQQRKILNNSASIGAGLIDGLRGLGPELADTLGSGECADWAKQLGALRAELERVIRQLKERAQDAQS